MRSEHLYIALLSTIGGVLFGSWWNLSYPTIMFVALLSIVVALLWRRLAALPMSFFWQASALMLFCFALGLFRITWQHDEFGHSPLMAALGTEVVLRGEVIAELEVREASVRMNVRVGEDVLLVTADRYVQVAYGDQVEVTGVLKEPEAFVTDFGRIFDYPGYLRAQGIEYQISFADVAVVSRDGGNVLLLPLLSFKAILMRGIESALPEPAAGLGEGLLLGVKQALGTRLEQAFRETGIIHIVVLSGYNVMIVVAFILYFLRTVVSARTRVLLGFLGITSFALMVGLSATVVRACIMAGVLLIAEATGRQYLALRALLLAAVLMLMWNPYLLMYDVGFQLSFMATLGLILISPRLEPYLAFMPTFASLRTFLGATVATQIAVLPLLLFHIGQVSIISVVVNLLVLPLVPVAMLLTFLVGLLSIFFPAGIPVLPAFAYATLLYIITVAETFAALPFAAVALPSFPGFMVVFAYVVMGGVLVYFRPRTELETADPELLDWTIEVEVETDTTKGDARSASPSRDLPVYFR